MKYLIALAKALAIPGLVIGAMLGLIYLDDLNGTTRTIEGAVIVDIEHGVTMSPITLVLRSSDREVFYLLLSSTEFYKSDYAIGSCVTFDDHKTWVGMDRYEKVRLLEVCP